MEILAIGIIVFCTIIGLTVLTIGTIMLIREMVGRR